MSPSPYLEAPMSSIEDLDDVTNVTRALAAHVQAFDWGRIEQALACEGFSIIPRLLTPAQCRSLAALYGRDALFRSRIDMSRYGFGSGEYKYLAYPLPGLVQTLRAALYPHLVPLANHWAGLMHTGVRFPPTHAEFVRRCHDAGQTRPTPLILEYGPDDYNCLHQDLYGEHVFPLQVTILLSDPDRDFTGGEFVLTEQRPRRQSRAEVVTLAQGEAIVFAVSHRPVEGSRGTYRVNLRHGVSRVRSGQRHTLGIIFHDAL